MKTAYIIVLAILMLIIAGCTTGQVIKSDSVKLDLYVMSQCPYGVQAENAIAPVLKTLGNSVKFNLYFIGGVDSSGGFQSLHGENEVNGDMLQACAIKYEPAKFMDLVVCMNQNAGSIPANWEACADQLKLNKASIKSCYEGAEGKELLKASFQASEVAGAQGSPTIKINGNDYAGKRDAASFTRAICRYVDSAACKNVPACTADADCMVDNGKIPRCENAGTAAAKCEYTDDAKFAMTVVNDKSCADCDASQIVDSLKKIFLSMDVRTVDISTDEGKKIVSQYGIDVVPAFIFEKSVEQSYVWKSNEKVKALFEQKNGNYKLLDEVTGATHYVSEEKRLELLKKIGVTLGDNKPQIDFFVMAYCPYGNQAEEIIDKVYEVLGDKAIFNPHYVIYSNYGGADYCLDNEQKYCSMHGGQELHQDVRELCVNKYMGIDKWFSFAVAMNSKCTAANADTCWEAVAKDLGLDAQKIKDCQASEAETLLAEEKKLNNLLGVQGSPTIFIEGEEYGGTRDANAILAAMCNAYDSTKPAECGSTIAASSTASAAPASGGCGG
jgi:glutaredoxin